MPVDDVPHDDQHGDPPPPVLLVIRWTFADMGFRPLPTGSAFWTSPDIVVAPVNKLQQVPTGQDVSVSVTVQNLGITAASAVVATFWWVDPSTSMIPTANQKIGTDRKNSILAGQAAVLTADKPWRPQFVNGGHECLYAEVTCLLDPVTSPFRPDVDRHVAQKNVSVADPSKPFALQLSVGNPFTGAADTQLLLQSVTVKGAARLFNADASPSAIDILQHLDDHFAAKKIADLQIQLGTSAGGSLKAGDLQPTDAQPATLDQATQNLILQRQAARPTEGEQVIGQIDLPEGGAATIEFSTAAEGPGDSAFVHHIRQISRGIDVGGYTVIVPPRL